MWKNKNIIEKDKKRNLNHLLYCKSFMNKPGGERQIPYDLTFNWNLINKRKKQTKYNQRH